MYLFKKSCTPTCPEGFYGEKYTTNSAAASANAAATPETPTSTCLPCHARCPKCHDPHNCAGCPTTCTIRGAAGERVRQGCSTCTVNSEATGPPATVGPGGSSGGPDSPIQHGPTVNVVFNATLPAALGNASLGNTTYQRTDACGINTTHTATTVSGKGIGGKNQEFQQFWCSWWSDDREDWVTDGCSAVNINRGGITSLNASNASSTSTATSTVTCKCAVVLPAGTKDTTFSGDFSLITNYAFHRVSSTFEKDTPFETSPTVLLLCCIPSAIFLLLLAAFRFIPHRIFSYQRGGHLGLGGRKEWCVGRVVCECVRVWRARRLCTSLYFIWRRVTIVAFPSYT